MGKVLSGQPLLYVRKSCHQNGADRLVHDTILSDHVELADWVSSGADLPQKW